MFKYAAIIMLFVLLSLVFCISLPAYADYNLVDDPNGFRGFKWGTDVSNFNNLIQSEVYKDKAIYTIANDSLKFGGASVVSIKYEFYKGKFSAVLIKTDNLSDSISLLDSLQARFGEGYQSNRYIKDYCWFGPGTYIVYKRNLIDGRATVALLSEQISRIKDYDKKTAAQQGVNDF